MEVSWWLLLDVVLLVYWLVVAVFIVSEDRDPTSALAWLLLLIALPVLGLLIYFFFGRNWPEITRRSPQTRRVNAAVAAFMPAIQAPHLVRGQALIDGDPRPWLQRNDHLVQQKISTPPMPVRTCDFYASGQEYFDALLSDLAGATRFIHMSYFIWKQDALTARITEVLLGRLEAGVEVRILNDYLGCLRHPKDEMKRLTAAGAIVKADMTGLARLNYRNHRKITVVDAEIGHTGGFNVAQEYIDGGARFPAWRDTGMRITGPGVADLEKLFDIRWLEAHGENLFEARYYPDPERDPGDIWVHTVHQGYDDPWNALSRSYQLAISGARETVRLQSPYFVPDESTMTALTNAAAGGVRVDLMTTAWLDKRIPWWAAESFFEPFLAAGGRIWQWEKGFFHAKSLTIDGTACAVGTLNLDIRSLRINKELMVWVYDPEVAARHEQIFLVGSAPR